MTGGGNNIVNVVLTDIRMPGIGGVALCRMVRRDWPHTDVVLMTGFASLETAAECFAVSSFLKIHGFGENS